MGGMMSRQKGKRGEREVITILQPVVSAVYEGFGLQAPLLQRNTLQSHRGGFDVVGLEWMALEVKYDQSLAVDQWWKQTLRQCGQQQAPVLFYRRNNVAWKVRVFATLTAGPHAHSVAANIDLEDFLKWFRARLTQELTKGG